MPATETNHRSRISTAHVLIIIALAVAAGRIAVVTRDGVSAFLSANDRSRWCTVASLVERGSYAIDAQEQATATSRFTNKTLRPWPTIDKVRHTGEDGQLHYYSSKPPLFPTMVAGVYAAVRALTGMTLTAEPMYMTRILLALVNLPLLALFYLATIDSIYRICRGDWARQIAVIAVCFGTMLLPFAITLNNHLPAAAATAAAMWIYVSSAEKLRESSGAGQVSAVSPWCWFAAGLAAAFAAANELPALSMTVFWCLLFFLLKRQSIMPFVAGAAVIAIGFFGTNWIAHHSLRPPYAHRGNGPIIAQLQSQAETPDAATIAELKELLQEQGLISEPTELSIAISDEPGRWVVQADGQLFALLDSRESIARPTSAATANGSPSWQLALWDDWYEYPGTHWKPENLSGVDRGEPSRIAYFAQMMIGHHGIFSLHPIWLLVPVGLIGGLRFAEPAFRRLAMATLIASVVCILFYLSRPTIDRNYGGVSVCYRWLLWFAPLWLLAISPVFERLAESRIRRGALIAMLAISVFSMSTALASPWQHPWLYQFWAFLGWIDVS